MILDSSRNELVPFAKDLEALKLYVELEQLRFDHKFSYQTIIDPELLNEDYSVPPLLIQPYVENAIIHGLAQSDKEDLRLLVAAKLDKGYIIYTIQDNGIGRKQSAVYKQGNYLYKSMGMEITQQRINVHNKQQQAAGEVTITDLQDEFGEPKGTKVQVKLKAI
jgi:LytS/YehU family sensor histidine kinase